jgi:K+ transporter
LILLFIAQSFGSSKIAFLFGPIMMVWFAFIAGTYSLSSPSYTQLRS